MVLVSVLRLGSKRPVLPAVNGAVREIIAGMVLAAETAADDPTGGAGMHMVKHADTPEVAAVVKQVAELESVTVPEVVAILTRAMTGRYTTDQLLLARCHARANARFCLDLQAYYAVVASHGSFVDAGDVVVCLQAASPPAPIAGLPAHAPTDDSTIAFCTDTPISFVDGAALQELAIEMMMGDKALSPTVNETRVRSILQGCASHRAAGAAFPDLGIALVAVHFKNVALDDAVIAGGYAAFCALYCGALIAALHTSVSECDIPVEKCWVVGELDLRAPTDPKTACASAASIGCTLFNTGKLHTRTVVSRAVPHGDAPSSVCAVARDTANGHARLLTSQQTVDSEWAEGRSVMQAVLLTDAPTTDDYYVRLQKLTVVVFVAVFVLMHAILFAVKMGGASTDDA